MKQKAFLLKVLFTLAILTTVLSVSVSAAALGDVDNDGKVTAADARLALRASVGLEKYTANSAPFTASDVDADGRITAADARLILRAAVGLEKLVPKHVHSFGAWTAEKNEKGIATGKHVRTCACGEKETAACTFGTKVYTSSNKTPTCTQGTTYYTECSVCKYKKTGGEAKLGHSYVTSARTEATCTVNGSKTSKCKRCGDVKTEVLPALGHQCKGKEAISLDNDIVCSVCHQVVFGSFNKTVNNLKTGSRKFDSFKHTVSSSVTKDFDVQMHSAIKNMGFDTSEFADIGEENETEEYFSSAVSGSALTKNTFPVKGKDYVSALQSGDITSFIVTPCTSIDMLKEFPDTITMRSASGATNSYSLKNYKQKSARKVNKVEIVIPTEKYSQFKDKTTDTSLMKITGSDIRKLKSDFEANYKNSAQYKDMIVNGMAKYVSINTSEIATGLTCTYYFDAVTNEPLAAKYTGSEVVDCTMQILMTGKDMAEMMLASGADDDTGEVITPEMVKAMLLFLGIKESDNLLKVSSSMQITSTDSTYYFFDGYFK